MASAEFSLSAARSFGKERHLRIARCEPAEPHLMRRTRRPCSRSAAARPAATRRATVFVGGGGREVSLAAGRAFAPLAPRRRWTRREVEGPKPAAALRRKLGGELDQDRSVGARIAHHRLLVHPCRRRADGDGLLGLAAGGAQQARRHLRPDDRREAVFVVGEQVPQGGDAGLEQRLRRAAAGRAGSRAAGERETGARSRAARRAGRAAGPSEATRAASREQARPSEASRPSRRCSSSLSDSATAAGWRPARAPSGVRST